MADNVNIRAVVLEMLLLAESGQEYSHLIVRDVLNKYDYLSKQDKAFIKRLFEGCIEKRIELDYRINLISNVKTNKLKPVIRNILRMGEYQLLYMDSVPQSAACNEAVKLAVKKGFHSLKGFVNGIMRNLARENGNMELKGLDVRYSMPSWIVEYLCDRYGEADTEVMLKDMETIHGVTVRVLETLSGQEVNSLVTRWEQAGITVKKHPYLSYAYCLDGLEGADKLDGFLEGKVYISDVSSMLIAEIAGVKEDDIILDTCAAPGGKSLHMLDKLKGTGHLYSRDVSDYKTDFIRDNVARSGYGNVTIETLDATVDVAENHEQMDIVLADVPCSGLGVMGKKRDIKYHASMEGILSLVTLQREILNTVSSYVKPGGALIYSTCTITKEENTDQIEWFLKEHPEFEPESIEDSLPKPLQGITGKDGYLQLLPGIHETDGFFMAKLRRKAK